MEKGGEMGEEEGGDKGRGEVTIKPCLRCYCKPLEGMGRLFKHDNRSF